MTDRRSNHPLVTGLGIRLRAWRAGLLRIAVLRFLTCIVAGLAIAGIVDFLLPMPEFVRIGLWIAIGLAGIWVAIRTGLSIKNTTAAEIALEADRMLADPRRSLLSAYELHQQGASQDYLAQKTIADSQLAFQDLPEKICRPTLQLRHAWIALGGALLFALILLPLHPTAFGVIAKRLFAPMVETPPFSPLRFEFLNSTPEVVFGGDLEIEARISGGEIRGPVQLLTRYAGTTEAAECFRGTDGRFSQRLEKITRPVEIAFATGKARSEWLPVHVRMEPLFSVVRVAIEPPTYTAAPKIERVMAGDELRAVAGSLASLVVTSNRPLSAGSLTINPADGSPKTEIPGELTGQHTVQFDWDMTTTGEIEVWITDVQGTPCADPLRAMQRTADDTKPRIAIVEPAAFSLATPNSKIPVVLNAQDDFGLRRVSLIRAMPDLRGRALDVTPETRTLEVRHTEALHMRDLGVQPGDMLEFYGEARDYNPALSGIETSEPVRISIISDEAYTEKMREQVQLDELMERYRIAQEQLAELSDALETLSKSDPSSQDAEKAREHAETTARKTAELYETLSEDLALYEMEKAINEEFAKVSETASQIAEKLAETSASDPNLPSTAQGLKSELNEDSERLQQQFTEMQDFEKKARIMEMAAEFLAMVEAQDTLARDFDRSNIPGGAPDLDALAANGRQQENLRERLESFSDRLREAATELPDDEASQELRKGAEEFAGQLENCGANESMEGAINGATNQDAPEASGKSRLAHEQLASLIPEPGDNQGNCFGAMCRGFLPRQSSGDPSMGQCLSTAMGRRGLGSGPGDPNDGFAVSGTSPLNIPVFGPPRTRFQRPPSGGVTGSISRSEGSAESAVVNSDAQAIAPDAGIDNAPGGAAFIKQVPEKYRSAVRQFFSIPDDIP